MLCVGWYGWDRWMDGKVIIGHRSSKCTFGAKNDPCWNPGCGKMVMLYSFRWNRRTGKTKLKFFI